MGAIVPFGGRGGIEIENFLRRAEDLGAELISLASTLLGLVTAAIASSDGEGSYIRIVDEQEVWRAHVISASTAYLADAFDKRAAALLS